MHLEFPFSLMPFPTIWRPLLKAKIFWIIDNDYPSFNFSSKKKLTVKSTIAFMLAKNSNRDKSYTLHTDHDYLSNHLWVSLLIIRYRDLSSDTFSNFTKKERSDSDIPYLAILLHYTLSVLVICKSNSKNSRPAPFIFKYPQLCNQK